MHKSIEESIQDLSEYLQQRLGGRGFYSERKGLPNLLTHHCHLRISEKAADKWCELMSEALEENEADIPDTSADLLNDFFRFTAFFLVVADDKMRGMKCKRTYDPFPDPIIPVPDVEEAEEEVGAFEPPVEGEAESGNRKEGSEHGTEGDGDSDMNSSRNSSAYASASGSASGSVDVSRRGIREGADKGISTLMSVEQR